jgi:hypothetical protein
MPSKLVLPYKRRRGQSSGFKRSDKRFQNRKRRIERMPIACFEGREKNKRVGTCGTGRRKEIERVGLIFGGATFYEQHR